MARKARVREVWRQAARIAARQRTAVQVPFMRSAQR